MTQANPFVLEKSDYKRDLNPIRHYVGDVAFYLSIETGRPIEECRAYVNKQLRPGGKFEFKDPTVHYLERNEHGDREQKSCGMHEYLQESIRRKELIAPTYTTYKNQDEQQSVLVDFIDENVKARGRAKKEMFAAEMAGDTFLQALKEGEQRNKKLANNAISGAHVSSSTPLFNRTSHSTLTSNCRSTSGYGNANNEKFLCGNRHYHNPKIALNNIVSIVNHTNYEKLSAVMAKYQIRPPTEREMFDGILYSTRLYWRNAASENVIWELVQKLSPIQRAAFMYTGDLYHLAKFNDDIVRTFLHQLSRPIRLECENAAAVIKNNREEYRNLAVQLLSDEFRGKELGKELKRSPEEIQKDPIYNYLASTILNIHHVIQDYSDLIDALWVTDNIPASLSYFPDSIRRAALTSDTDSTIFTVQDWVFWMHGPDAPFNADTYSTTAMMIFLAAETITHVLARMSANFGITTERIHQVAMKNEFLFDVFAPTPVGKHYFAIISCQEGNLYKEFKPEIKGVHLKSSNAPKPIMRKARDMMVNEILMHVYKGNKLSMQKMLRDVAIIEHEVMRSMRAGETTYFRNVQIKPADTYTKEEGSSPYQHYLMWQEVFAPKYGDIPPPPYGASKISVTLKSPRAINDWLESIQDKALQFRMRNWLQKYKKSAITALALPHQILQTKGLPEEIIPIMNIRRGVYDITSIFYLILETVGYYAVNKNLTHLVSDRFTPEEIQEFLASQQAAKVKEVMETPQEGEDDPEEETDDDEAPLFEDEPEDELDTIEIM